MNRRVAAAGSVAFFILAPGVVAGLVPWLLTRWQLRPYGLGFLNWPLRLVGAGLIVAGAGAIVSAFARFVAEGRGTPAPLAPPQRLVIGGLYRYVRNPMYVAVVGCILGQELLLGQPVLLGYAAIVFGVTASFVRWYEEPHLRRRFGADYEAYRREVPGWLPRTRPWRPPAEMPDPDANRSREPEP